MIMEKLLLICAALLLVLNGRVLTPAEGVEDEDAKISAKREATMSNIKAGPGNEMRVPPTKIAPPSGTRAVFDSEGYPCVLAEARATFLITFPAKLGKKGTKRGTKTVSVAIPEDDGKAVKTSGICDSRSSLANITYTWGKDDHFQFTVTFEKGKVGRNDVWRVKEFALKYDRSDAVFNGTTFLDGGQPLVVTDPKKLHFQVPHEMSLACDSDKKFDLFGKTKDDGSVVAIIHHMKFHPFLGMSGTFGEVYWCRPDFDERVPIAVGSVMAVMTVVTVAGYALFKKFRPKKADYDTME